MLISILKIRFITIHCYGLIFVTANSPFHRSPPMKPGNLSFVSKKRRKSSYTISSVIQPLKEKLYICFRKPACNASVTPISSYHPRLPKRTLPNGSATIAKCCSKSLSCPVIHKTKPYYLPEIRIEQSCEDGPIRFDLHITVVIGNQRIPFSRFRKTYWKAIENISSPTDALSFYPKNGSASMPTFLKQAKNQTKRSV